MYFLAHTYADKFYLVLPLPTQSCFKLTFYEDDDVGDDNGGGG